MINIILADDHQIVRDGIKSMLSGDFEIAIVAEAADGEQLFSILKSSVPDIVLLDISMPGMSGIEICRIIHENNPEIKVIILSMYSDEEFVLQALRAGAFGYLPKNISRDELTKAIKLVFSGEQYISPLISSNWINSMLAKAKNPDFNDINLLSKREIEILKLCAEGLTNKEISNRLFISGRTVESHKTHIMQKLDIKTAAGLTRFALKNNLTNL